MINATLESINELPSPSKEGRSFHDSLTTCDMTVDSTCSTRVRQSSAPGILEMRTLFAQQKIARMDVTSKGYCSLDTILDGIETDCKEDYQRMSFTATVTSKKQLDLMDWDTKTVHTRNTKVKRRRSGTITPTVRRSPRSRPTLDVRRVSPNNSSGGKSKHSFAAPPPAPSGSRWTEFTIKRDTPVDSPLIKPKRSRDSIEDAHDRAMPPAPTLKKSDNAFDESMHMEDVLAIPDSSEPQIQDIDTSEHSMWKSCNRSSQW